MAKGTIARATILGRMGRDIEVKDLSKGRVGNFSLAVNQGWGNNQTTSWINIVVYNDKKVEAMQNYTAKGSKVLVEGELRIREFQKSDGTKGYATEVVVSFDGSIEIVEGKDRAEGGGSGETRASSNPPVPSGGMSREELDDDVPF